MTTNDQTPSSNPTGITYNDGAPAVAYTLTRSGQTDTVTVGTDYAVDLVYDPAKPWRLSGVGLGAFYGDRIMSRLYNETGLVGLPRGFQLGTTSSPSVNGEQSFTITARGRVGTLSAAGYSTGSRIFTYGYRTDSGLLETMSTDSSGYSVSYGYEAHRDMLANIESRVGTTSPVARYDYTWNAASQMESVKQSGTAFADYGASTYQRFAYNDRDQVTQAVGYRGDTVTSQADPLPGRHNDFSYDVVGNFKSAGHTGVSDLDEKFTANGLNQYTSRENNGVTIAGTADSAAKVLVRGNTALAGRSGAFYSDERTVANSTAPYYGPITILTAILGTPDRMKSDTRQVLLASALQHFSYDDDGNLEGDGLWDYTWDAENRLKSMETTVEAQGVGVPHSLINFRYDYLGRRVQKQVYSVIGTTYTETSCRRYLYDGWNLVAEFDAMAGTIGTNPLRSYVWGLDLSGSLTASGGVGALLEIVDHTEGKTLLASYTGSGSVAALVNASSGDIEARYEYSPFGELLRCEGVYAKANPFRFSTKFTDDETGLVCYGFRYYSSHLGRFINRDPLEESGGINLYGFCRNDPVNRYDYLGMYVDTWADPGLMHDPRYQTNVSQNALYNSLYGHGNYGTSLTGGLVDRFMYGSWQDPWTSILMMQRLKDFQNKQANSQSSSENPTPQQPAPEDSSGQPSNTDSQSGGQKNDQSNGTDQGDDAVMMAPFIVSTTPFVDATDSVGPSSLVDDGERGGFDAQSEGSLHVKDTAYFIVEYGRATEKNSSVLKQYRRYANALQKGLDPASRIKFIKLLTFDGLGSAKEIAAAIASKGAYAVFDLHGGINPETGQSTAVTSSVGAMESREYTAYNVLMAEIALTGLDAGYNICNVPGGLGLTYPSDGYNMMVVRLNQMGVLNNDFDTTPKSPPGPRSIKP